MAQAGMCQNTFRLKLLLPKIEQVTENTLTSFLAAWPTFDQLSCNIPGGYNGKIKAVGKEVAALSHMWMAEGRCPL